MTKGLDYIMRLKPVTYEWKNQEYEDKKGTKFGLIAQDVLEVFPEIVTGTGDAEKEDWYGVDDYQLPAPMIKAIQELKVDADRLQGEIDTLRFGREGQGGTIPDATAARSDDPATIPWNAPWVVWVLLALNATLTTILIFRRPVAR
jgi:hypothetical protein